MRLLESGRAGFVNSEFLEGSPTIARSSAESEDAGFQDEKEAPP